MKTLALVCAAWLACLGGCRAQDLLDRLDDALNFSTFHDEIRLHLGGLIDAEGYYFEHSAPGFIEASRHSLFNPRLTLLLNAQLGQHFYFFGQARFDRGFDPSDQGAQVRLDEYALRYTPWQDNRLNVQFGKSATVFGTWVRRHLSWENPFVTAPLAYDNSVPVSGPGPNSGREYLVVVWGPDYTTGLTLSGQAGRFDYAAEFKNASLSSRPESWSATEVGFDHPAYNARLGFRPDPAWNFGASVGDGLHLRSAAGENLPGGGGPGDYREITAGQDASYAAGHWELWAEAIESRFEVVGRSNLDTFSYFAEAKYKFTPQLFGALRWNQQISSHLDRAVYPRDVRRVDAAVTFRLTPHLQWKLQYTFQGGEATRGGGSTVATQITARF